MTVIFQHDRNCGIERFARGTIPVDRASGIKKDDRKSGHPPEFQI
jgi:hypothetical protein